MTKHHPFTGPPAILLLLVGPKGAGKSTLGRLLQSVARVHFFEVEQIWLAYRAESEAAGQPMVLAEGRCRVRTQLDALLKQHRFVSAETTGADPEILEDFLQAKALVRVVRLRVALEDSLARIEQRDASQQLPPSKQLIEHVHALSEEVQLACDMELATADLNPAEAAQKVAALLGLGGNEKSPGLDRKPRH